MTFITKIYYLAGTVLLIDSGYSSYKINQLGLDSTSYVLPVDLQIETVLGTILVILGAIFDARANKNRELGPITPLSNANIDLLTSSPLKEVNVERAMSVFETEGFTPFDYLDNRSDFVDWNARRRRYTTWLREQGNE